ncbi:Rap1a/Tai family immunity protein [Sphingopyxis sp.]|uniref:Rap1a/Tai family immunity protein n=1 Tax=Sphingopyxis sp. TaxID=1908224 RepID=UPI003BA84A84
MLRTVVRISVSVAVLLGAATAMPAAAQDSTPSSGVFKTGQQVYDLCTSKSASELDTCDTFIMAAHDMIKLYGDTKMAEGNICLPTGTTVLEVRGAVLDYWRGKKGGLKFSAVSSIRNALFQKYTC